MTQDRREFMGTVLAGASSTMLGGCATTRSVQEATVTRPIRRSVTGLASSSPILTAYRTAIAAMKALPSSDRRNWTNQARIHNDYCPHGNWLFLPWHRAYLLYFERICRNLSGMADFALPYWNWSVTRRVPAPFWSGQLLDRNRIATASSVADSGAVGAPVLGSILSETNFQIFGSGSIPATAGQRTRSTYGRLEGTPHNYIHGFIGGDMGNFMSPLDPIFWLHHTMIERCWVNWNFDRGHANPSDPGWLNREFTEFCDENGNPVRVTVAETLGYPATYYRYDDVGPGAAGVGAAAADSSAVQNEALREARSGANVNLEVVRQFTAPQPAVAEIDRPTAIRIPVDPQALRTAGERTLLVLEGVSLNHTEDFSVRVFINKPDATANTPPEDPHFAGAFAFFDHQATDANHDHGDGNFVLDVSDVMKRLGIEGGAIEADVVLVPFPGRQPRTRALTISATELRVVKDVVQPQ
jgi:tyrosinase